MDAIEIQKAMDRAAQVLCDYVWETRWAGWITYLLEKLDVGDAATSAEVLTEIQDSITARLATGQW